MARLFRRATRHFEWCRVDVKTPGSPRAAAAAERAGHVHRGREATGAPVFASCDRSSSVYHVVTARRSMWRHHHYRRRSNCVPLADIHAGNDTTHSVIFLFFFRIKYFNPGRDTESFAGNVAMSFRYRRANIAVKSIPDFRGTLSTYIRSFSPNACVIGTEKQLPNRAFEKSLESIGKNR